MADTCMESSHYPELSPFTELRHRAWCFVNQMDAMSSFQTSLPSMTYGITTDTAEPRSLHYWELTQDMTQLPPSKPPEEETPMAYLITKSWLSEALGKFVRYFSALQPISYEIVLQLDDELLYARLKVPLHSLMREYLEDSVDFESIDVRRAQLEFLYHQGTCILHRKFFAKSRIGGRYSLSRERCLESSMALLRMQNMLYEEAKGKGRIREPKWNTV